MSRSSCSGCAHEIEAHEHCRAGTDCALCDCTRYRSWSLQRLVTRAAVRPAAARVARPVRAVRQLV